MNDTWNEMVRILDDDDHAVVATIVHTRGSTPREVGTRMLIGADGRTTGTIGGGCGEADIWAEAMDIMAGGNPRLVEVDLLHDEDAEGGRACGGLMYVFLEPLGGD
jgi:xanthine/CO dehydrogenase XdhC/CoxF family maturation factor